MISIQIGLDFGKEQEKIIDNLLNEMKVTGEVISFEKKMWIKKYINTAGCGPEKKIHYAITFTNGSGIYQFGFSQGRLSSRKVMQTITEQNPT